MTGDNAKTQVKKRARCIRRGRRLAELGFPADADCRLPVVTLTGGCYIKVEHHTGVLQLGESTVRLCTRIGVVTIQGSGLAASDMDGDMILLDGCVKSVVFE